MGFSFYGNCFFQEKLQNHGGLGRKCLSMNQKIGKYGEPQKCFSDGLYLYCNFVVKNGIAIYSPNGWMKFLPKSKKEVRIEEEEKQKRATVQS